MAKSSLLTRSWSVRTMNVDSEARQEGFSTEKSSGKSDIHSKQHGLRRSLSAPRTLYRTQSKKQLPDFNGSAAEQLPCASRQEIFVDSAKISPPGFSPDVIGIALGSPKKDLPSLPPEAAELRSQGSLAEPRLPYSFPSARPQASCRDHAPILKIKTSRWKKLGVFFGKKDSHVPDTPLASFSPTSIARQDMRKHEIRPRRQSSYRRDAVRDKRLSKSTSRTEQKNGLNATRAGMKRSQTVPLPSRGEKSPTPPPKDVCFLETAPRLLQVNIPKSEMERFSVMFSSLHEPGPGLESSLLLARRQGHLEKLRNAGESDYEKNQPIDKTKAQQAPGQAYSLGTRSASFSLFPSTPPNSGRRLPDKPKLKPKPSPLQTSVAIPDVVPDHSAVPILPANDTSHFTFVFHSPAPSPTSTTISQDRGRESELSSSPAGAEWCFADAFEPESKHAKSFPPSRKDSLLFREHSNNFDVVDSKAYSTAVVSQSEILPDCATVASPQPEQEAEHSLQRVAEISIARQISVSRQQRHLLVPIVPQTARHPIKPTLVDVGSVKSLRRSHHALLEDV